MFKDVSVVVEHSFSRDYQSGLGNINMTFLDESICHRKNRVLWTEMCSPKIHIEFLTPLPRIMTLFGDRAFKEAVKVK